MFRHLCFDFLVFFFSFLSETHLSYLAWSWFFSGFGRLRIQNFFHFFPLQHTGLFLYSFKIPFSCFPLSFSFRPFGRKCTYTTIALPSPQHKHKSVSQSAPYARYPLPFSTSFISVVFFVFFSSSHTYPNSRRFEVSYSNFVCVLSIISFVLSTLYLDGRKGFFLNIYY